MHGNPELRYFAWPAHLLPAAPSCGPQHAGDSRAMVNERIAELLGAHVRTVSRLRAEGLDYWWADRLATRVLRVHPSQVWPNWWFRTTLANLMDEAVA